MFKPHPANTAIVITDPQNDFLSPGGKGYHLTKSLIEQYNTLGNLEILMHTAMSKGYQLFISPHYIYPHDYNWQFTGAEQEMLLKLGVFQKQHDYTSVGADWVPSLKPYILSSRTVITTAHKVASPQSNDLVYQLRQHRKEKIILAGILSNICVESHMRDLIENGFQTAVVYDATATISEQAFQAALTNYQAFSSATWSTQQAISQL
ncbi:MULTISPECIES: isochorismatase family cysteine hydrolase [Paenibacillus]|uniref:Isochorismatase family protein n=1 Tax=Paenibacillus anseongense TaxID=2682845 RepID=A0ABW9UBQ7_9BACL|nr:MULTISPECIES: isochorismatase family cysteine hydrolase [Paenibacillus]MBA2943671.1 cysteine hydrolase [Paenibacillus sp. CGMCC 1.16610]MVQ37577.1 isochorismatase family protein [Paenibacillus anseongense]